MKDLNLDMYLKIAREEAKKQGLDDYVPLYPMLRKIDDKLFICIALTEEGSKVWDISGDIIASYWMLIDIATNTVLEFNKTSEKSFIVSKEEKKLQSNHKEISKYSDEKALQYKNYLIEDIKKDKLPLEGRLFETLGNEFEIDGEKINLDDYLLTKYEEDIQAKINDLVEVLIYSKYGILTFYYDFLFKQIIDEYSSKNNINLEKMKLCVEIMNNYYTGVIGIEDIFNI